MQFIFRSNGIYLGFVQDSFLFSRDGLYLAWMEDQYVWDSMGKFRGTFTEINGHNYLLLNQFAIPPLPKSPKVPPPTPPLPNPQPNIQPISLPIGLLDAF